MVRTRYRTQFVGSCSSTPTTVAHAIQYLGAGLDAKCNDLGTASYGCDLSYTLLSRSGVEYHACWILQPFPKKVGKSQNHVFLMRHSQKVQKSIDMHFPPWKFLHISSYCKVLQLISKRLAITMSTCFI